MLLTAKPRIKTRYTYTPSSKKQILHILFHILHVLCEVKVISLEDKNEHRTAHLASTLFDILVTTAFFFSFPSSLNLVELVCPLKCF